MFLGPFEQGGDYRDQGIVGPHGFLARLWQSVLEAQDGAPDANVEKKLHQTIRQVTEQMPELGYNTAIAALMEYLNVVRGGGRTARRAEVEPLVVMLAPFAPHIAEELYQRLGHNDGLFDSARWPAFDAAKAAENSVEIAVQVNGKLRARLVVGVGAERGRRQRPRRCSSRTWRVTSTARPCASRSTFAGKLLNLVVG